MTMFGTGTPGPVHLDLTGRTALVTGAASGIGRACALRLAAAGARVLAVDRDPAGLAELAAGFAGDGEATGAAPDREATRAAPDREAADSAPGREAADSVPAQDGREAAAPAPNPRPIGSVPTTTSSGAPAPSARPVPPTPRGRIETHVLDLTDLDAAERVAAGADILVNNAGIQLVRPIERFPPEVFHDVLTVMLEAPFRLVRGALPHMYAQGFGRVVNISSVHGLRASPYKSAYVAAKHGLEGLSKVTALEGAAHGVTSNCVSPGYVRTPLVERQIADQAAAHGIPAAQVEAEVLLADSAIKRLVEPAEVAEAVAYLCTPEASFITGASLPLDGGWSAH
ncbi:SDR family oxidoreductase [Streptomyces sp. NPDC003077]|uniref:SDR family oxidoreductase n=1 Tax=Streptomyces sp. NPDC003077 TaxID=3154443 RepID=UPI0033B0EF54